MKVTRWSPDTCGCVIDYQWDEKLPEKARVHQLKAVIKRCPAHQGLNDAEIFDALMEENPRKNYTLGMIADELLPNGTDEEKQILMSETHWEFDQNRQLNITLPQAVANVPEVARAKAAIAARFGNRVKIS